LGESVGFVCSARTATAGNGNFGKGSTKGPKAGPGGTVAVALCRPRYLGGPVGSGYAVRSGRRYQPRARATPVMGYATAIRFRTAPVEYETQCTGIIIIRSRSGP